MTRVLTMVSLVQVGTSTHLCGPRGAEQTRDGGMSELAGTGVQHRGHAQETILSNGVMPNPLSLWGQNWALLSEAVSDKQRELISIRCASSQGPLHCSEGKAKPTQARPCRHSPSRRT